MESKQSEPVIGEQSDAVKEPVIGEQSDVVKEPVIGGPSSTDQARKRTQEADESQIDDAKKQRTNTAGYTGGQSSGSPVASHASGGSLPESQPTMADLRNEVIGMLKVFRAELKDLRASVRVLQEQEAARVRARAEVQDAPAPPPPPPPPPQPPSEGSAAASNSNPSVAGGANGSDGGSVVMAD